MIIQNGAGFGRALVSSTMLRLAIWIMLVAQPVGAANQYTASAGQDAGEDPVVYISLPPEVTREMLISPNESLRGQLHEWVTLRTLSAKPQGLRATVSDGLVGDRVVVFKDHEGRAILPDLERSRSVSSLSPLSAQVTPERKEIDFTFNSSAFPWSDSEVFSLKKVLADCYPLAKKIYGEPAFNITVNIRKDPSGTTAGLYYTTLNEMVLRNADAADPVCHEMLHAFRDDNVISLSSFEEGMVRAAEVELFNRLPSYTYWNRHHSYSYDVYYEGLSKRVIGGLNGSLTMGYVSPLVRYQLSGYAWSKVFFQNWKFFVHFNAELYRMTQVDGATPHDELRLMDIARNAQPVVEGVGFRKWYRRQGVLTTNPPRGYFIYPRVNQWTVDYFARDRSGKETMQPWKSVNWEVYNHSNQYIDGGTGVTSSMGWFDYRPAIPEDYSGRIKVVLRAMSPLGEVANTSYRYIGAESGIFGIVTGALSGNMTVTPLGKRSEAVTVEVARGAFVAPSLKSLRGRFEAVFVSKRGLKVSKRFNKDRSNYFLQMRLR